MSKTNARQGFTLIEIMIVVAVIALLVAMAVPGFLRARKRSQAAAVLELYRTVEAAKDQYSANNPHLSTIYPRPIDLASYMKPGTQIYSDYASGVDTSDIMGNKVYISILDVPPQVANGTVAAFSDVIDNASSYWGAYYISGAARY